MVRIRKHTATIALVIAILISILLSVNNLLAVSETTFTMSNDKFATLKTAWTDGECEGLSFEIESLTPGNIISKHTETSTVTKYLSGKNLYLGTNCYNHDLKKATVQQALIELTREGDCKYYMVNNEATYLTGTGESPNFYDIDNVSVYYDFTGTLHRGTTEAQSLYFLDRSGQHKGLIAFLNVLMNLENLSDYDNIFFTCDGMLIGRTLSSYINNWRNYPTYAHSIEALTKLKEFAKIWAEILPEKVTFLTPPSERTYKYYLDSYLDTNFSDYYGNLLLFSPSFYLEMCGDGIIPKFPTFEEITAGVTEYGSKKEYFYRDTPHGDCNYGDSTAVSEQIQQVITSSKPYNKAVITGELADGITLDTAGIKVQYKDSNGEYHDLTTGNFTMSGSKFTYTVNKPADDVWTSIKITTTAQNNTFKTGSVLKGDLDIKYYQNSSLTLENVVPSTTLVVNGTPYTVYHYIKKYGSSSYELYKTETPVATANDTVSSEPIEIEGYIYNSASPYNVKSGLVTKDGNLVLKCYYDLGKWDVTYDPGALGAEGTVDPQLNMSYGQEVSLRDNAYTLAGATFKEWKLTCDGKEVSQSGGKFTMPAGPVIATAQWNEGAKVTITYACKDPTVLFLTSTSESINPSSGMPKGCKVSVKSFYANDCIFTYWKDSKGNIVSNDSDFVPSKPSGGVFVNETYTAYYIGESYIYNYFHSNNTNWGTVSSSNQYFQRIKGTANKQTATAKTGYHFVRWAQGGTSDTSPTACDTAEFTPQKNDYGYYESCTYYAIFAANTDTPYKVIHMKQKTDGTYETIEEEPLTGTTGSTVNIETKTFDHYHLNSSNPKTVKIDAAGNTVVQIKYDLDTYTVTYKAGLSSYNGSTDSQTFRYGQEVTLNSCGFYYSNYTFVKWEAKCGTEEVEVGLDRKMTMPAGNVEATATWKVTLFYYINSSYSSYASVSVASEQVDMIGGTPSGCTCNITPGNGYVFDSWKVSSTVQSNEATFVPTIPTSGKWAPTSYYAYLKVDPETPYNVQYYLEDENGTYQFHEKVDYKGTCFSSVNPASSHKKEYDDYVYNSASVSSFTISAAGNSTAILYYKRTTYTLTYSSGLSGTSGTMSSQTVRWGAKQKLTNNAFSKTGYRFNHWKATAGTEDVEVTSGQIIMPKSNTVATAVWDTKLLYCSNNTSKGTVSIAEEYVARDGGTPTGCVATPKTGYLLDKWTLTNATGTKVSEETSFIPEAPSSGLWDYTTYYANFIPDPNTKYKIEHYLEKVDGSGYELKDTENKTGATDSSVTATQKTYTGFTYTSTGSTPTDTIKPDGTTVLKLNYARNKYTVSYSSGLSSTSGTMNSQSNQRYESMVTLSGNNYSKTGYTFVRWSAKAGTEDVEIKDGKIQIPASNVTCTAIWKAAIKYVSADTNKGTVGVASEDVVCDGSTAVGCTATANTGYHFVSWKYSTTVKSSEATFVPSPSTGNIYDAYTYTAYFEPNTDTAYTVEHYKQKVTLDGYDIVDTDTENLKGTTDATVSGTAKTYAGFKYNSSAAGSVLSGSVKPDGSLVLKLYYDRKIDVAYTVEHYQQNVALDGYTKVTADTQNLKGIFEDIAKATPKIYIGFTLNAAAPDAVPEGSIKADGSLVLKLYYDRNTDTKYIVKHYQQTTLLNSYTEVTDDLETLAGITGATATATAKTYEGFTFNETSTKNKKSGVITADGTLELSLYYDRNKYSISYEAGATNASGTMAKTNNVVYGANATLAISSFKRPGYSFDYWTVKQGTDDVEVSSGAIVMPAGDCVATANWKENSPVKITYLLDSDDHGYLMSTGEEVLPATGSAIGTEVSEAVGYIFEKWVDKNGNTVSTDFKFVPERNADGIYESATYTAKFTVSPRSKYTVKHFVRDVGKDTYSLKTSEVIDSDTDAEVEANPIEMPGFTYVDTNPDTVKTGTVTNDCKLELKLYYERNQYSLTYKSGSTEASGTMGVIVAEYEEVVDLKQCEFIRNGYNWVDWDIQYSHDTPVPREKHETKSVGIVSDEISSPILTTGLVNTANYNAKALGAIEVKDGCFKMPAFNLIATAEWDEVEPIDTGDHNSIVLYIAILMLSLASAEVVRRNFKIQ